MPPQIDAGQSTTVYRSQSLRYRVNSLICNRLGKKIEATTHTLASGCGKTFHSTSFIVEFLNLHAFDEQKRCRRVMFCGVHMFDNHISIRPTGEHGECTTGIAYIRI